MRFQKTPIKSSEPRPYNIYKALELTDKIYMRFLIVLIISWTSLYGGTLQIHLSHQFDGKKIILDSLRNQGKETFSISRLSYLLSSFALQSNDGTWIELEGQYAYIDLMKRRVSTNLTNAPTGNYQAIRFSIGIPKKQNHADPSQLSAEHPLNPNLNQLHWDQAGGYIFLALEGKYRDQNQDIKGYVYHLANDVNFSQVQIPADFSIKSSTRLTLAVDASKLLNQPRALSFEKDGDSTHSHLGDPIASALVANLQSTFSLLAVQYPPNEIKQKAVTPLFLPKNYTPYAFRISRRFPRPVLPRDNPLLEERVALGKKLFHDPRLSRNNTISCASCHHENLAFTDNKKASIGIDQRKGKRNSMPLFNLAWKANFFWDGRAKSLRDQVLEPIQDHLEMDESLPNIATKLKADPAYISAFAKAFSGDEITAEKVALALENHLLTLTSYSSKFDQAMAGKATLTEQEKRGFELFFTEHEPRSNQYGADCFHCHGGANFSDHQFHNNGLTPTEDLGLFITTKKDRDKHRFSTPSLRNIALTAPYMHDGRFQTLSEVIDHYTGPMHQSPTLNANLAKHPKGGLQLSKEDKDALVSFLKTLTDPQYTSEP